MAIKLSNYIAKRLKEHGVTHFFMVSGGGAMHLNDSLGHAITYTSCHNEQACAFAAEGYARLNQNLAVVNVTTGPGGLNCLNGLFGQYTDSIPVLYISGQVKTATFKNAACPNLPLRQLGDQEVDIISMVKHLTKYSKTVTEPSEIKYHIDKAIYEATTGRKGPVWLDIPIDIQASMIDENDLKEFTPQYSRNGEIVSKSILDTIATKLKQAKRPLIIAGHGIRLSGTQNYLYKILEKSGIPVVTTFNGFDLIPDDCKNYIGRIGTVGQRAGNIVLQNADLILCLGTRNNVRQVSYNWENFGKNAYKIVVDIDKAELEKPLIKPDLAVNADLKDFLPEFLNNLPIIDCKNWLEDAIKLKGRYCFKNFPEQIKQKELINPYEFTYVLSECLNDNDIYIMANGSACVCTFQNAVIKKGQRYILNSGDASMGFGLPAAIGASYEAGGRNVICLEGDGSIMMNIQELQTVVHNKLPIKIFVINNNGYSSIRQSQRNFFNGRMAGSGIDSGVSVPDFVKIGNAFELKTKRIDNPKTMQDEIMAVLNEQSPIICEVITETEYSFIPKLSSKILPDGTIISPDLADMYPFLDDNGIKS